MFATLIQIALGGALGAVLRAATVMGATRLFGPAFPWGTLVVNVLGSVLMGVWVMYFLSKGDARFAPFALVGVLGGFTTFSSFSLDALKLFERGEVMLAAAYVIGSVALSLIGIFVGFTLARLAYT